MSSNIVSGAAVDRALAWAGHAEAVPVTQLNGRFGLDAATWYADMSTTIADTREVANQLVGQVTARAGALRSDATRRLVLTSVVTLGLLLLARHQEQEDGTVLRFDPPSWRAFTQRLKS